LQRFPGEPEPGVEVCDRRPDLTGAGGDCAEHRVKIRFEGFQILPGRTRPNPDRVVRFVDVICGEDGCGSETGDCGATAAIGTARVFIFDAKPVARPMSLSFAAPYGGCE